jgi:hypothetical protein
MVQLDYAALDAACVQADPFTHLVVRRFVGPDLLPGVLRDLPEIGKGGLFAIESLRMGSAVRDLVTQIQSRNFCRVIADKFEIGLDDAPTLTTLRGRSRAKDGRIHTDSSSKRVTVLLYLNRDRDAWHRHEGCLRLLRSPDDIEDFVAEVPPIEGNMVVFLNGASAWHGYRRYVGMRYVLQLNYMTSEAVAQFESRRHRLSAIAKRLKLAR